MCKRQHFKIYDCIKQSLQITYMYINSLCYVCQFFVFGFVFLNNKTHRISDLKKYTFMISHFRGSGSKLALAGPSARSQFHRVTECQAIHSHQRHRWRKIYFKIHSSFLNNQFAVALCQVYCFKLIQAVDRTWTCRDHSQCLPS